MFKKTMPTGLPQCIRRSCCLWTSSQPISTDTSHDIAAQHTTWHYLDTLVIVVVNSLASRSRRAISATRPPRTATLGVHIRGTSRTTTASRRRIRRSGGTAASTGWRSEDGELGVIVTLAAGARGELRWALDLLEGEVRVVGVLEPVEAPLAAGLESSREGVALAAGADTAVLSAWQATELALAPVKEADAAAWHVDVEVIGAKITTGTGRLDDHGLASNRARGEGESGVDDRQ